MSGKKKTRSSGKMPDKAIPYIPEQSGTLKGILVNFLPEKAEEEDEESQPQP